MKPLDVKNLAGLDARRGGRAAGYARALAQALLALAVLAAGYFAYQYMLAARPAVFQRPAQEQVWAVSTVPVSYATHQPSLSLYGQTVAARRVEMRALVAGEVVSVSPALREGGRVDAGEQLLGIDRFAYEGALREARANLREAEARLAQSEAQTALARDARASAQEQLTLAERDLERAQELVTGGNVSRKTVDDRALIVSQRQQAVEQQTNTIAAAEAASEQQRAQIARLTWKVEEAERALANTALRAPFAAYVTGVNAEVGRVLGANDIAATLLDASGAEVKVTLSDRQYGRILARDGTVIGRPVEIVWNLGETSHAFPGEIVRVGAEIATQSGGIDVYARIETDNDGAALRPGAFVEVRVPDRAYDNAARLPETALYGSDTVYVPVDGRLVARKVELVGRDGKDILVSGDLAEGERVVTSRITEIGEGLRVEERAAP